MKDPLVFDKIKAITASVIPVVVQHIETREVLILAYMTKETIQQSAKTDRLVLWSTSRQTVWEKGATSGDVLWVKGWRVSCQRESIICEVLPETGGVCHQKDKSGQSYSTCFYQPFDPLDGAVV